jgi:hypothetical protein
VEEQLLSSAAKLLAAHGTWKRHASDHFARNPGFIWARPLSEAIRLENNATVLRAVLRPVLDSMRDFQLRFQLPWKGEPAFGKDDVNETQDLILAGSQPSLVQNES